MYKLTLLKLVFTGKISFTYWLRFNPIDTIWVYTDKNISMDNEYCYGDDSGMKLISENVYQFEDGSIIYNPEHKGIYLKQDDTFVKCTIEDNKLIPVPKEQIILDFPKAEIIRLRNKAKEKNLSLKDYLTNQINSIL